MSGRRYAPDICRQTYTTGEYDYFDCNECLPGKCKHHLHMIDCLTLINGGEVRRAPE